MQFDDNRPAPNVWKWIKTSAAENPKTLQP